MDPPLISQTGLRQAKIQLTCACPHIILEFWTRDTLQWNYRGSTKWFALIFRTTPQTLKTLLYSCIWFLQIKWQSILKEYCHCTLTLYISNVTHNLCILTPSVTHLLQSGCASQLSLFAAARKYVSNTQNILTIVMYLPYFF